MEACRASKVPIPSDRRAMVNITADYLMYNIKDTRRITVDAIGKQIMQKYPKSFQDTIEGKIIDAGGQSLKIQIYNAIMYKRDLAPKRRIELLHTEIDDECKGDLQCPVSRKFDEYGCVDYQPLLPETETNESQEKKRLELSQLHNNEEQANEATCLDLMEQTYPSQRMVITAKKRNLVQLLKYWPYLSHGTFLIAHANRLLGKPLKEEWDTALLQKAKTITNYFKITNKRQVTGQAAGKETLPVMKTAIKGLQLIDEAKEAAAAGRNVVPEIAVIFPLLTNHFKEDEMFMFRVFDVNVCHPENDIFVTPLLI